METNLKDVKDIIQAFDKYGLLKNEDVKEILVNPECQTHRFLMKVLNLDQDAEAHRQQAAELDVIVTDMRTVLESVGPFEPGDVVRSVWLA